MLVAEHAADGRYPRRLEPAPGRGRLRRAALARAVGPRRRPRPSSSRSTRCCASCAVPRPLNPIGIGWAGPTLLVAGTDAQQQRWLPGILDGSELWCQLFSEPGAGSDLASLQTRAVRDGDEYVVNGQKVWTTLAHVAQLRHPARRAPIPTPRTHHGITYFVVDMRTPGIEVRPLVQMTGTHEFNEVFFTDVRVPAANVVGAEHDGWRLAKVTLGNERVSLSGEGALWGRGPTANDVIDLVRAHGGTRIRSCGSGWLRSTSKSEVLRLIRLRTRLGAGARARARPGGVGAQGARRTSTAST